MTSSARHGLVKVNGRLAGVITEADGVYVFTYDVGYLSDPQALAISLSLPKRPEPFRSPVLFPFFSGLLSEGTLATIQCRALHVDERDEFGRLLTTCRDTIGAVTVEDIP